MPAAARRAVVVLCAIAFVFVNLAHANAHLTVVAPTTTWQVDLGASGEPTDVPVKATLNVDCGYCCVAVTLSVPQAALPICAAAPLHPPRVDKLWCHSPLAETPPPRTAI
jgi:hypothetical protein